MAKISTKTFNPAAGVNLPGWALEEYETTAGDLSSIVDSLTKTYERQRQQDMDYAFDVSRLRQDQRQYDDTLEYTRQQDAKELALKNREQLRLKRDANRKHELDLDQFEHTSMINEATLGRKDIDNIIEDIKPDQFELGIQSLEHVSDTGNPHIDDYKQSHIKRLKASRNTYQQRMNTISILMPEFAGLPLEELDKAKQAKLKSYTLQSMRGGAFEKSFSQRIINNIFPEFATIGDREKLVLEQDMDNFSTLFKSLLEVGVDANARMAAFEELQPEMRALQEKILNVAEVKAVDPNDYVIDRSLYEDYAKITGMSISDIEDKVTSGEIDTKAMTEAVANKLGDAGDDKSVFQRIHEYTWEDLAEDWRYLGIGKSVIDEALMETAPAKAVTSGLDYVGDIWKDTEMEGDVYSPLPLPGGFQAKLSPAGKTINRVGKTIGRFFPQMYEDFKLVTSGKAQEFAGQGLSGNEMIKKIREGVREKQGGVYYTPHKKFLVKNQLIGKGKMFMPDEITDDKLASLPNKMVNPAYLEEEIYRISGEMSENIEKVGKPLDVGVQLAGPELKKAKEGLSKSEKELLRLQKLIEEAEKHRLPGLYRVTSDQVQGALDAIRIARGRRIADPEKERIDIEVSQSTAEMKKREKELEELLDKYRGGIESYREGRARRPWYESPLGTDPFGRAY